MVEILEGNLMIMVEKEDRMHYNRFRKTWDVRYFCYFEPTIL